LSRVPSDQPSTIAGNGDRTAITLCVILAAPIRALDTAAMNVA
jgi:hypothetical protein